MEAVVTPELTPATVEKAGKRERIGVRVAPCEKRTI
jgi:hypothetical protein